MTITDDVLQASMMD